MGLKGNLASVAGLKSRLRAMPVRVAQSVARRAAPDMTSLTRSAFDSGQTVYGEARPRGVRGPLTLERTGATRRSLHFTAVGTVVRCVLGTRYSKYLIGRYRVLPNGGLPLKWSERLRSIVAKTQAGDL